MSRRGTENVNVASVTLDVWSLGVLSYYWLVGSWLFACDQRDNIHKFDIDEEGKLAFWRGLAQLDSASTSLWWDDFIAPDLMLLCPICMKYPTHLAFAL